MSTKKEKIFKTCPMCKKNWMNRDSFLDDPELNFNGYQANLGIMTQGLFYFTHENVACGSTMILEAEMFLPLYKGIKHEEDKSLSKDCPKLCFDKKQLVRCPIHCEYAFVREVSQIIKDRSHKAAAPSYV